MNKNTPIDILEKLSISKGPTVRSNVASNENNPAHILELLAKAPILLYGALNSGKRFHNFAVFVFVSDLTYGLDGMLDTMIAIDIYAI